MEFLKHKQGSELEAGDTINIFNVFHTIETIAPEKDGVCKATVEEGGEYFFNPEGKYSVYG